MTRTLRPRANRRPNAELANFVDTLPVPDKVLGLAHTTNSYLLRDVLRDGHIHNPNYCEVIGEPVAYAFYGRAAFRNKRDESPSTLSSVFPVALLLDPHEIPAPKYVFGFDSGAFMGGMMDQHLHPYMPLFDFLLTPSVLSAARLVSAVFPTTEHYFKNHPEPSFSVPAENFEAESYLSIVKGGSNVLDDRASTPELLFVDPIELRRCVRAAIIPDALGGDDSIGGQLRREGLRVLDYPWTRSSRPSEHHFVVRTLARHAFEELGWL